MQCNKFLNYYLWMLVGYSIGMADVICFSVKIINFFRIQENRDVTSLLEIIFNHKYIQEKVFKKPLYGTNLQHVWSILVRGGSA